MANVLVIISTLKHDPRKSIDSAVNQTTVASDIFVVVGSRVLYDRLSAILAKSYQTKIIYAKPDFNDCLGKRVTKAMNVALSMIEVERYDYILKLDADTILPPRFLEENLKVDADIVGTAGYAMLIKVKTFIRLFNGRFEEVCADDTYLKLKFMANAYTVREWRLNPILAIEKKPWPLRGKSLKHFYVRGIELYKMGYEPLHVLEKASVARTIVAFLELIGYLRALIKRAERYEFSGWVFKRQLKRLVYGRSV